MARRRAGPEIRGHLRGQSGGCLCQDNKEVRAISEGEAILLKTKRGGRQAGGWAHQDKQGTALELTLTFGEAT